MTAASVEAVPVTAIAAITWRRRARVRGRIAALRIQPFGNVPSVAALIGDETGSVSVVFLGRRRVPGVWPGRVLECEGMVGERLGQLAILNPVYEIVGEG